jgi:hypothetical protein
MAAMGGVRPPRIHLLRERLVVQSNYSPPTVPVLAPKIRSQGDASDDTIEVNGKQLTEFHTIARNTHRKNAVDLLLDANPDVASQTPAGAIASTLKPSMPFSNSASTGPIVESERPGNRRIQNLHRERHPSAGQRHRRILFQVLTRR